MYKQKRKRKKITGVMASRRRAHFPLTPRPVVAHPRASVEKREEDSTFKYEMKKGK
jgi:hypothetical protein